MADYKILTINPGSTSTKIALFHGAELVFSENVSHNSTELDKFENVSEQLIYRRETILNILKEKK